MAAVIGEFAGTIRASQGDSYLLTFADAPSAMAAAERLGRDWAASSDEHGFNIAINFCLHRGTFPAFRSFVYGSGLDVVGAVLPLPLSLRRLGASGPNIFATGEMGDGLIGSPWHGRLELLFPTWISAALAPATCFA